MSPAPEPEPVVSFDVRRGNPTEEELAALMAVVAEAYAEEAAAPVAAGSRPRARWRVSTRSSRSTLSREQGWGGFSA